jgi:hypothetical protein
VEYLCSLVLHPIIGTKYANRKYGSDWFSEPDLKRFDSPTALLNDTGINGGAIVLRQIFSDDQSYRHHA